MPRKSSSQSPASAFAAGVAALAAKASQTDMASALGALVKARTAKPAMDPFTQRFYANAQAAPKPRRRAVRRGRNTPYAVGKYNDARYGTFRHHLIAVAQRHTNTYSAEAEHADSKFADKKLDFAWLFANGYITTI